MKNRVLCLFFGFGFTVLGLLNTAWAQTFSEKLTTESNVGMTINSLGIIGNAFRGSYINGQPSCKYPRNSDIEHLFNGGLWVGGLLKGETRVTTGAFDASTGYTVGGANYEFVAPFGSQLRERSYLIEKQDLYDPRSVSHQDFLSDFTDTAFRGLVPGTQFPIGNGSYTPLGLSVHMETYNWNFPYSNFFVILNFTIKNVGTDSIVSPYVGYWSDAVIRNVRISPPGTANFFGQGGNGYLDSLFTSYEFDAGGDLASTRSYFAMKFLGSSDAKGFRYPLPFAADRELNRDFKCNYNTWQFRGQGDLLSPATDAQKYQRLASSMLDLSNWTQLQTQLAQPFNRSNLISAGPFATLYPGDSIQCTFAIILADRVNDGFPPTAITKVQLSRLANNATYVQSAYNGNDRNYDGKADSTGAALRRFILPSPPSIPVTKIVAKSNSVDIYWNKKAELSRDAITGIRDFEGYRVYKTKFGFDVQGFSNPEEAFEEIASFDKKGNSLFFNTGFEKILLEQPEVIDGDTMYYKYSIKNLQNGWQHIIALEAFDEGNPGTGLPSLATGPLNNQYFVYPGKTANPDIAQDQPYVYPNPYYATAAWENLSSSRPEDKRLVFANLPKRASVKIFTASGELVDEFQHDDTYRGQNVTSIVQSPNIRIAGGEHYWDLLSNYTQIIARGLYLFTVTDNDTGKAFKGTFTIIK